MNITADAMERRTLDDMKVRGSCENSLTQGIGGVSVECHIIRATFWRINGKRASRADVDRLLSLANVKGA